MKITVLDKCTVTTGDVSLDEIKTLGEVFFYDVVEPSRLIETIGDSDAVICNKARITDEIMSACKNLKYVGLFATGYNNIDIEAAKRRGITVCNVPGYSTDSVAQQVFAMILHFATSADAYNASVARGDWANSKTFSYLAYPITELAGKTLGIFGFGTIGKRVAEIGQAFGMKIIAVAHKKTSYTNVEFVDVDALFARSDYLTLHCPLTDETHGVVNSRTLSLMKPTAVLINTARGGRGRACRRAERRQYRRRGHRRARRRADAAKSPVSFGKEHIHHSARRVGLLRGAHAADRDRVRKHPRVHARQADKQGQLNKEIFFMDNEQTKKDFEQVPVHSFNVDSSAETLSVLLRYRNKKSILALFLYFSLLLLLEAIIMLMLAAIIDKKILIYEFTGSLIIVVLFMAFMIYGTIKSRKKQLEKFRNSPPSYVSFELYIDKLIIKKYAAGELKSLYTAEKGTLTLCDISKDVFIFNNDGIDFGIKNETLKQYPEIRKFIIENSQRKSKKISA